MKVRTVRTFAARDRLIIPFVTAKAERRCLENVILELEMEDGQLIRSEIPSGTTIAEPERREVLQKVKGLIKGLPVSQWEEFGKDLRKTYPRCPLTVSAFEIGLFKAFLYSIGTDQYEFFGSRLKCIETDITVPFLPVKHLEKWLEGALRDGFSTFKVKLKGNPEEDLAFLSFICRFIKERIEDFKLRLDFNRAYDATTFHEFLRTMEGGLYPVELLEEPTREPLSPSFVRSISYDIILDESIMGREDLLKALDTHLLTGINIKLSRTGISESLGMVGIARKANLKLMLGCMMESFIGLSTSIYLACGQGSFEFVDLDSVRFLGSRSQFERITVKGPFYEVG